MNLKKQKITVKNPIFSLILQILPMFVKYANHDGGCHLNAQ